MDDWKELLRLEDVDVDDVIKRFSNKEERYIKYLNLFLQDDNFELINKYVAEGDVTKAFECCHTLKGVVGNLGFRTLYTAVYEACELLRAGKCEGVADIIDDVRDNYNAIIEIICNNLKQI